MSVAPEHDLSSAAPSSGTGITAPSGTEAATSSRTTATAALSDGVRAWAVVAGVAGIAANAALIGFFALADPWTGEGGTGWWLGPVNDLLGTAFAGAMIPVVVHVSRAVPTSRAVRVTVRVLVPALGALALAGVGLVTGVSTLQVQFAVSAVGVPALVLWLFLVGRAGERTGALDALTARWGRACGVGMVVGAAIGLPALAFLPGGSPLQVVALGLAALPWLVIPVWPLLLARRRRPSGDS